MERREHFTATAAVCRCGPAVALHRSGCARPRDRRRRCRSVAHPRGDDLQHVRRLQSLFNVRPVIVPALNWYSLRPVIRSSGYSSLRASGAWRNSMRRRRRAVRSRMRSCAAHACRGGLRAGHGHCRPAVLQALVRDAGAGLPQHADFVPDVCGAGEREVVARSPSRLPASHRMSAVRARLAGRRRPRAARVESCAPRS